VNEPQHEAHDPFERARRAASRLAWSLFALSFTTLLVLSASPYWYPGNDWLVICDQVWKMSGLAGLALSVVPYFRRAGQFVAQWFDPGR